MQEIIIKIHEIAKARHPKAYLVGGCVRDLLLRKTKPITDWDVAVTGDPKKFSQELAEVINGTFVLLDEEFQTCRVVFDYLQGKGRIDLTGLRGDKIEDDLKLRDFTIDAMGIEITEKTIDDLEVRLIDPLNGLQDLEAGKIKVAYGNAFQDDPLRMLRAIRLAATLGFKITGETEQKIREFVSLIRIVAGERIRDELFIVLNCANSFPHIKQCDELGLLSQIIPEINQMHGIQQDQSHHLDVWQHSLVTLQELEQLADNQFQLPAELLTVVESHLYQEVAYGRKRLGLLKFIALLHDIGKPQAKTIEPDGRIRFIGHDKLGAEMCKTIARRLRLNNDEMQIIGKVIKGHLRPGFLADASVLTKRAIYRFFRDLGDASIDTLILSFADRLATRGIAVEEEDMERHKQTIIKLLTECLEQARQPKPKRLLTGHDIMKAYNLPPGPLIGKILTALEEAQATGEIKTKREAWELADRLVEKRQM